MYYILHFESFLRHRQLHKIKLSVLGRMFHQCRDVGFLYVYYLEFGKCSMCYLLVSLPLSLPPAQ